MKYLLIILCITGWGLFFFSLTGYLALYKRLQPMLDSFDHAKCVWNLKSLRRKDAPSFPDLSKEGE